MIAWTSVHYIYQVFSSSSRNNDLFLIFLNRSLSEPCLYVIKAVFIVLQVQAMAAVVFPQAFQINVYISINVLPLFIAVCYCSIPVNCFS